MCGGWYHWTDALHRVSPNQTLLKDQCEALTWRSETIRDTRSGGLPSGGRMIAAQDRVHETLGWDWEAAQAEHERALAAYQKICDEMGM